MSHPLLELQRLRQSPWHDNIRREQLTSGKLAGMIADGDITGLTSNPTIFEQAIAHSSDYDADLETFAREGRSAEDIFDRLSRDDVQAACDLFAGVYERSGGRDGFCSIEVAPKHARDTATTIAEAKRLWAAIDRPNLMVKIPATREGIPAIEASIAAGINVNVTLIFSLERYEEVMNAHLRGLLRRSERGEPLGHVASVASFFVSRVDGAVDRILDEKIARGEGDRARLEGLHGRAAIANAKLAYAAFQQKCATEAWAGLAVRGAQMQRPLWASTSTKNPSYPDVYYVEALVGPDTVDTMPPATLVAYKDHGRPEPRIMLEMDEAERVMNELAELAIDMSAITQKLEEDGVAAFAKSFDSLIALVEERRRAAIAPRVTPAAAAPAVPASETTTATSAKRVSAKRAAAKPRVARARATEKPAAKTKRTASAKKKVAKKPAARKTLRGAAAKTAKTAKARKAPRRIARRPAATKRSAATKPLAKKRAASSRGTKPATRAKARPAATRVRKTTVRKKASRAPARARAAKAKSAVRGSVKRARRPARKKG